MCINTKKIAPGGIKISYRRQNLEYLSSSKTENWTVTHTKHWKLEIKTKQPINLSIAVLISIHHNLIHMRLGVNRSLLSGTVVEDQREEDGIVEERKAEEEEESLLSSTSNYAKQVAVDELNGRIQLLEEERIDARVNELLDRRMRLLEEERMVGLRAEKLEMKRRFEEQLEEIKNSLSTRTSNTRALGNTIFTRFTTSDIEDELSGDTFTLMMTSKCTTAPCGSLGS